MEERIKRELTEATLVTQALVNKHIQEIKTITELVIHAYQNGGRLIMFGNGGSAADAQHIVAELVNYLYMPGRPMLDALALTVNTSVLTAIGNDVGYENIFARQKIQIKMESITTRCPARISFGNGGDTDYYIKEIGWGCIVNATLSSLYFECKINGKEERAIIYNDHLEKSSEKTILQNLKLEGDKLDLIKATISYLNPYFKKSIEINTNIPKESGLGGSSTLNVALALALLKDKGELTNPEELAKITYYIERKILQVEGGYQDQWAAAYGRGLNLMIFKNKRVEVVPIKITKDTIRKLEENSILVYFSQRRDSGKEIHKDQENKIKENPEELRKIY